MCHRGWAESDRGTICEVIKTFREKSTFRKCEGVTEVKLLNQKGCVRNNKEKI